MACFMRMSLMAPLRLSILARAVCTASRAFTRFFMVSACSSWSVLGELGFTD